MHTETISCDDLGAMIDHYTSDGAYRLDMIMPADAPRIALLSGVRGQLRLELDCPPSIPPAYDPQAVHVSRVDNAEPGSLGRAGMQYRDLLPSRAGGRFIASHICIPSGGPVSDYVHFHQVGFQVIYCRRGWVRVVYEDQGPPFVMDEGDCVLQPPTIRHRVLEASRGLEVVEIASPAEHPTFRDHEIDLPTPTLRPDRDFGGQRFIRHVAATATWQDSELTGFEMRESGIGQASRGQVNLRILRCADAVSPVAMVNAECEFRLLYVLAGCLELTGPQRETTVLRAGDSVVLPQHGHFLLATAGACELLEVSSG